MTASSIEWTDETWNPIRGCTRVSEGCRNCYAETFAARFGDVPGHPFEGFARMVDGDARWTGKVSFIPEKLNEPLRWKRQRRVFVNSMSDLFHEELDPNHIADVFGVMARATAHTFQVLTKRPERMRMLVSERGNDTLRASASTWSSEWPLANVWLGVSVEDQATADERIPLLLQTPAAKRFVSYEPALGPVDFERIPHLKPLWGMAEEGMVWQGGGPKIDWIIVGGESGPGARPFDVAWARLTVRQCRGTGVACFVKQLGAKPIYDHGCDPPGFCKMFGGPQGHGHDRMLRHYFKSAKGGDPSEWPEDLRVREFPK